MTNEEKKRLDNIAQLQSKVELNQNKGREKEEYENLIKKQNEFNNKTIKKDSNIKREITTREKAEMEMKKWAKTAKNKPNNLNKTSINIKRDIKPYQFENNENEMDKYDNVVSMDMMDDNKGKKINNYNIFLDKNKKSKDSKENNEIINSNVTQNTNDNNKNYICLLCQRKFANEEKLKIHEQMSQIHKENLLKQKNIEENN